MSRQPNTMGLTTFSAHSILDHHLMLHSRQARRPELLVQVVRPFPGSDRIPRFVPFDPDSERLAVADAHAAQLRVQRGPRDDVGGELPEVEDEGETVEAGLGQGF